jgi:hypothetical protein
MSSLLTTILTPVVTYLAMLVANAVRTALGASPLIGTLLVPVVGGLVAFLGTLVSPSSPWEVTLVISLGSVWLKKFLEDIQNPSGS